VLPLVATQAAEAAVDNSKAVAVTAVIINLFMVLLLRLV
jgi:hypothetical protein